jgi:adenosylhomocysteine nucleosidase
MSLITQSGIGKVNAAISTTLLINKFKPDIIINTGSAEPVLIMMSGLNLLINNVVEIAALTFPMPLWVITT